MFRVLSTCFLLQFALCTAAVAQDSMPTDSEARMLGLNIQWLKSAESYQPNFGIPGTILWPDRVEQEASTVIRSKGGQVLAVVDSKQRNVDYARYGFYEVNAGLPAPLGLDGMRKVAERIAKDYKLIGRQVTLEEVIRPVTYLAVLSDKGGLQMFDAETGKMYWSASVGDGKLPVVGPIMNDQLVGVLNGSYLFLMNKTDGKLIRKSKLEATVSALPVAIGDSIIAPQVNGTIEAYDLKDLAYDKSSLRFTKALRTSPVVSADGNFVSWASGNTVHTARFNDRFELWNRLETTEPVVGSPVVLSDGLLVCARNGTMIRLSYDRLHNIKWRANIGYAVLEQPLTNNDIALVSSANHELICVNLETGETIWEIPVPGIVRPLAIAKNYAYFQDQSNGLIAISLADGKVKARTSRGVATGLRNDYSDRLYLRAKNGQLMCLSEIGLTTPVYNSLVATMRADAKPDAKKSAKPEGVQPPANAVEETAPALETQETTDSPFGETTTPVDETNPFDTGN